MTKRAEPLIPLTHDHHHALVQARALISAAEQDDDSRLRAARAFLDFFEEDTLRHFHEEEEVLFPKLLEHVDEAPEELLQVLEEHVRIHGMVARLRAGVGEDVADGAEMRALGETLRGHVRLEENKLFPLIERAVPEAALEQVSFAERERS